MKKLLVLFAVALAFVACGPQEPSNPLAGAEGPSTQAVTATPEVKAALARLESEYDPKFNADPNFEGSFDVEVEYLNPHGTTEDGYTIYYIGEEMSYQVRIECDLIGGDRLTLENLRITVVHEYYENGTCQRTWYPYPLDVTYAKGDPLPGESIQVWSGITMGLGEEIVLEDTYTPTLETCSGLDQTHVIIEQVDGDGASNIVIYDVPETGIFDPPRE